MTCRCVKARLTRMAWYVASEPELAKSTFSIDGTRPRIRSASWTSSSMAPMPMMSICWSVSWTRASTRSSACPRITGPKALL